MRFFQEIVSNPDGTFSTKRTAGWICLLCAILVAFKLLIYPNTLISETIGLGIFTSFLASFLGSFGISSIDTKAYWSSKSNVSP